MAKVISAEIRGYIKSQFKLGTSARAIFNEICSLMDMVLHHIQLLPGGLNALSLE